MFSVTKKYVLMVAVCLLGIGQGFGATPVTYDCSEGATWGGYTLEPATKVNNVYEINTPGKLAWFSCFVNNNHNEYASDNAKLTADIKMNLDNANDAEKKFWIPICAGTGGDKDGIKYCRYTGIFDGDNHSIKGLYINGTELAKIDKNYAQNIGFVGVLGGGTIKNLVLEDVDIQASTSLGDVIQNDSEDHQISVGAFVGWMTESASNKVEYCMVSGMIKTTGKGQGVGGIVGNAKKGNVSNCMSLVEIQATGSEAYVGGIVGMTKEALTVASCVYAGPGITNTGENSLTGGIVGDVYAGKPIVNDNYFEGKGVSGVGGSICTKKCTPAAVVPTNQNATVNVPISNDEDVACTLNGKNSDGSCKEEPWAVGETGLSLNGYGKDGYKITFDANGGIFADGSVARNKFLEKDMAITADEIGNPSRDYYTFIGWAFTQDATEPENLGFVSHRETVYAVWEEKVKVTFDANGGTFPDDSETKDVYISKNSPITVDGLGSLPVSYCKQYSQTDPTQCVSTMYFMGWMNDAEEQIDFNNHDVLATVDVKYNAVWTDVETYSVTFHSDDNTTVDFVQWVDAGHTVAKPSDPEMEGYTFLAWYDGNAPFDFRTEINASKDLHAHWSPNQYNVSYDLSEGCTDRGDNPEEFSLGEGLLPLNPPTVQEGYVFDDWFYDGGFTKRATSIDRDVVGDKAFYAKCSKKTYRIMYTADNSSYGSASDQYVEHGSSVTLASEGIFWRTGYKQDGWSTTSGGDRVYVFGKVYTITKDLTLYPHWVTNLEITSIGAVRIYDYGDHKEAVIDGNYGSADATDEVQIPNDVEVTKVTLNRKFDKGIMSTIMLPFSINLDNISGGKFYRFKRVDIVNGERKIIIGSVKTSSVGANTPYMFLPEAEEITFTGSVTLNTETEPSETLVTEDGSWEFKGTYKYIQFDGSDESIFGFAGQARSGAKVGQFVQNDGSGAKILAMRAYLIDCVHKTRDYARSFNGAVKRSQLSSDIIDVEIEDEDGGVTAIGKFNTITGEVRIDRWFDLKGRRLNAKPTVQGTYYHNGKRVIVK